MAEGSGKIEQDIVNLEKKLQEKKAALERGKSETKEELPSEKEMLREVVGEKIQEQAPSYQAKPQPSDTTGHGSPSYLSPELNDKVQDLVNVVFNKSLEEAIKEATETNNPALIDAFHDALVDQLYNDLVERKKVKPIE